MVSQVIDTHTHLDAKEFDADRELVIERARAAGVGALITVGASNGFDSAERAIKLATSYSFIWATAGIHPHDARCNRDINRLRSYAVHPRVVAVGETGLDFFRDWAPKEDQQAWFELQIELAKELKKPVIIHNREAGTECFETLKRLDAQRVGGVYHCYSEDADYAKKLADMNFLVSFPGTITFKNAHSVRETAKAIPLSQIMVETDAPYMAPHPYRGSRCESAYVVKTAEMLAEIKGLSFDEVAEQTTANAIKLFGVCI